jgi:hypothetical protein
MIGHNPKANKKSDDFLADDFADVSALLRELPRVAVPTDFNASLKARIAAAKSEAHEFAGVTALVKELPRVAAPADFDFKLRARIARAKAEQQKASAGWFAEWFGRTFSWVQASAALAAVAIVVSVASFGVLRGDKPVETVAPTEVAKGFTPTPSVAPTMPQTIANDPPPKTLAPQPISVRVNAGGKSNRIHTGNHLTNQTTNSNDQKVFVTAPPAPSAMVANKVMIKHRSGEARMVNLSEYNLGLQTAHLRSTPASPRTETVAVNIY